MMTKPFLDTLPPWPWHISYSVQKVRKILDGSHEYSWIESEELHIADIDNSTIATINDPTVALLASLAPELLEALQFCECELTLYRGLAEQSENPQAWYDAIAKARDVMDKMKGTTGDEQPTLF